MDLIMNKMESGDTHRNTLKLPVMLKAILT